MNQNSNVKIKNMTLSENYKIEDLLYLKIKDEIKNSRKYSYKLNEFHTTIERYTPQLVEILLSIGREEIKTQDYLFFANVFLDTNQDEKQKSLQIENFFNKKKLCGIEEIIVNN